MIIQPVRDALDYYRRLNEASQLAKHRKSTDATVLHSTTSICDKLPPSESVKQFVRADSTVNASTGTLVGISEDVIPPDSSTTSTPLPLQPRSSNPMSYRRASQLLMLKASGSSNSLKLGQMRSSSTTTAPSSFQSFPSLESEDSEREEEGDESDQEEDPITEVAVSEKALKFKIATEPSFDFSTSRKGSRENKSESSGQSTTTPAAKDDRISYDLSVASLTPKVEMIPKFSVSAHGSPAKVSSSEVAAAAATPSSSSSGKTKGKDSFLKRLKVFTDKLSISADSASGGSTGSGGGSPSSSSIKSHHTQGFNYFRRPGKGKVKRQSTETASVTGGAAGGGGSSSSGSKGRRKHRGSNSDPEGSTHFSRLPEPEEVVQSESEQQRGGSRLGSPEYSPALSGTSGNKSYWKPCSGSLDSILSKDEPKRSPSRRLMSRLPPFFQRKSRLSFMNRSSSKNPDKNQS